jgi:hypothetical protein
MGSLGTPSQRFASSLAHGQHHQSELSTDAAGVSSRFKVDLHVEDLWSRKPPIRPRPPTTERFGPMTLEQMEILLRRTNFCSKLASVRGEHWQ